MNLRRMTIATPDARRPPQRPLPEAARRLQAAFPELWARYELLVSKRHRNGHRPPATPIGSA